MTSRIETKQASLQRILSAGAARLRREGLSGAAIVPVMQDAGLTHGAFYAHFKDKEALAIEAFRFALKDNRPRWMGRTADTSWRSRLQRLGKRYLTPAHRDDLADSCALAALASDAARSSDAFRNAYADELRKSLRAICSATEPDSRIDSARFDDAVAFMALCLGGISLARAVDDPRLSDRILAACRRSAACVATADAKSTA